MQLAELDDVQLLVPMCTLLIALLHCTNSNAVIAVNYTISSIFIMFSCLSVAGATMINHDQIRKLLVK